MNAKANSLAQTQNEQMMTSLQLAEFTGKRHKHLLRDIRNMEDDWEEVNGTKFGLVKYKDPKGEMRPMYRLTKMESLYVASKFDNKVRAKLVKRWHELETGVQRYQRHNGVRLYEHEARIFGYVNKWLRIGDIKRVADELEVNPNSVSRVKRAVFRSKRIMQALIERCKYNQVHGIVDGYQLELPFQETTGVAV